MSAPVRGWLFDVYPAEEGMVLWFLDADGRPHQLSTGYRPAFYAAGPRARPGPPPPPPPGPAPGGPAGALLRCRPAGPSGGGAPAAAVPPGRAAGRRPA